MSNITTAHIMVTSLCNRDCPHCCNKQYDLNDIPYITIEELSQMKHIYLTGGEPFTYSNPDMIALKLKSEYPNIESVVVYTNAYELWNYLDDSGHTYFIDGVTISIKDKRDKYFFERAIVDNNDILKLRRNRVYVFPGFEDTICPESFHKTPRAWQEKFVPAPNCIFRRL